MECKNDVKTINYRAGRKKISRLIPKQSANRNLELWEEGGQQHGFVFSSACVLSCVPWTVACHTPLSMELSRKEHWSRLPFPTPRNLPNPGIKLMSPVLVGSFFTTEPPVNLFLTIRIFDYQKSKFIRMPSRHICCCFFRSYLPLPF